MNGTINSWTFELFPIFYLYFMEGASHLTQNIPIQLVPKLWKCFSHPRLVNVSCKLCKFILHWWQPSVQSTYFWNAHSVRPWQSGCVHFQFHLWWWRSVIENDDHDDYDSYDDHHDKNDDDVTFSLFMLFIFSVAAFFWASALIHFQNVKLGTWYQGNFGWFLDFKIVNFRAQQAKLKMTEIFNVTDPLGNIGGM